MSRQPINVLGSTGNAASFPGTNNNGIKRALVSNSTGDYSAFCWINFPSAPSGNVTIIKNGRTGTGNNGWNFSLTSARKLNLSDPGGVWGGTSSSVLATNTWIHVGFIRSGTSTQFYVNGIADGSAISGSFNSPENDTTVGATYNDSSVTYTNVFNGLIDDVKIWTRALDPINELPLLVNPNPFQSVSSANLQLWWKMDETTGASTVADSSGNGRTGTIAGTVTFTTGIVVTFGTPDRIKLTDIGATRTIAGTRSIAQIS